MEIHGWNERYRLRERAAEDLDAAPTSLVVATAAKLVPGKALDLACGRGRNALWLAEHGWEVTAVDGAHVAIEILRTRALERGLKINAVVADLENGEFEIEPCSHCHRARAPQRSAFVVAHQGKAARQHAAIGQRRQKLAAVGDPRLEPLHRHR